MNKTCSTCKELLDTDCQGQLRCEFCDGPCPGCYSGPGPGENPGDPEDD